MTANPSLQVFRDEEPSREGVGVGLGREACCSQGREPLEGAEPGGKRWVGVLQRAWGTLGSSKATGSH